MAIKKQQLTDLIRERDLAASLLNAALDGRLETVYDDGKVMAIVCRKDPRGRLIAEPMTIVRYTDSLGHRATLRGLIPDSLRPFVRLIAKVDPDLANRISLAITAAENSTAEAWAWPLRR